jgi:hypothetical protein
MHQGEDLGASWLVVPSVREAACRAVVRRRILVGHVKAIGRAGGRLEHVFCATITPRQAGGNHRTEALRRHVRAGFLRSQGQGANTQAMNGIKLGTNRDLWLDEEPTVPDVLARIPPLPRRLKRQTDPVDRAWSTICARPHRGPLALAGALVLWGSFMLPAVSFGLFAGSVLLLVWTFCAQEERA